MTEINIRLAKIDDAETLTDMAMEFWAATDYAANAQPGSDPRGWLSETVGKLLDHDHILAVAETEKGLVGFIALFVSPHILIPGALSAHEVAWWVRPEGRRHGAGQLLLDFAERTARERGVHTFHMIALPSSPRSVVRTYLMGGYQQTEVSYTKVL